MDRQVFSPEIRVSRGRNGAVPVSVGLHAIAIGAAVLASAAIAPDLPKAIAAPPPRIPAIPAAVVRVVPIPPPPPKGNPKAAVSIRRGAAPSPPAAPAQTAPSEIAAIEETFESEPDLRFGRSESGSATPCIGVACHGSERPGPDGIGTSGPLRPGGDIKTPQRKHIVAPIYPPSARAARITGAVVIDCVIGPDGRVHDAKVVSGHPILREAALHSVRQWTYTRPELNGAPISVFLTVTVHFILN